MLNTSLITRFLCIASLILALLNIYFISCEIYRNFSHSEGITYPNTKVIGGDYLAFYTAGNLFTTNRENLYAREAQFEFQKNTINNPSHTTGFLPFVYPPLVASFFSLFASCSFTSSYLIWSACSFLLYLSGLWMILREFKLPPILFVSSIVTLLGMPVFFLRTIAGGQTGAIGVFLCAVSFLCMKRKKHFLNGIVASFFYYKPPLYLILVLWNTLGGKKNFFTGFLLSGTILIAASLLILPWSTLEEFFHVSINHSYGGTQYQEQISRPHKGAGLYAIIANSGMASTHYQLLLALLTGLVIMALSSKKIRSITPENENHFTLLFSIILTCSLFFSIHMLDYDLSILSIPMILCFGTLYNNKMYKELIPGLLILILFQLDLAIPDIHYATHTLSKYSFVQGFFLLYLLWIFNGLRSVRSSSS